MVFFAWYIAGVSCGVFFVLLVSTTRPRPCSVKIAKQRKCCRICRREDAASPGNPFVFNYGKEYAHSKCVEAESKLGE